MVSDRVRREGIGAADAERTLHATGSPVIRTAMGLSAFRSMRRGPEESLDRFLVRARRLILSKPEEIDAFNALRKGDETVGEVLIRVAKELQRSRDSGRYIF